MTNHDPVAEECVDSEAIQRIYVNCIAVTPISNIFTEAHKRSEVRVAAEQVDDSVDSLQPICLEPVLDLDYA